MIHIYCPRLDIPFKPGPVPSTINHKLPEIREHWWQFVNTLSQFLTNTKVEHELIVIPMWEITPELVDNSGCNLAFIPHKERHNFKCKTPTLYYMQMVFPWLFSIDTLGWCAGDSKYPIQPMNHDETIFPWLKEQWVDKRISKFGQPRGGVDLPEKFIFFPCQLPHDQTIRFHSKISVSDAMRKTFKIGKERNIPVVVKGHPVNPGAMESLKQTFQTYANRGDFWYDSGNIHDFLSGCEEVFTVNSGVGMEALLHSKPVTTFGRSDYDSVTGGKVELYPDFLSNYYHSHYDYRNIETFFKIMHFWG